MQKEDKRPWGLSTLNLVAKIFAVGTALTSAVALTYQYQQNGNFDYKLLTAGIVGTLVWGAYTFASSKRFYNCKYNPINPRGYKRIKKA